MAFTSFDGGEDDEYNCVGFVEISKIIAAQYDFFHGTVLFD